MGFPSGVAMGSVLDVGVGQVAKGVNNTGFESIVAPTIRREQEGGLENWEDGEGVTTAVVLSADASGTGAEVRVASFTLELFQRLVKLGMQCCAKDSSTRPTMRAVAKALGEMIEGKSEDASDMMNVEHFDEDAGEEVVLLSHNLGGEAGATVAFVMESGVIPR